MNKMFLIIMALLISWSSCERDNGQASSQAEVLYTMPEESQPHEATWLQWPHQYQYGLTYRNRLDPTWVAMTQVLVQGEKVYIIAYDQTEKDRITNLLTNASVDLTNIDFKIYPTDDVWVRDNGPIYVKDRNGKLFIEDWGFNAWGGKFQFDHCDAIPTRIADDQSIEKINLNGIMINEGGSVEVDGHGVLMACKSSILNKNRNPDMTQADVETTFTKYLGVKKFIWLEGKAGLDITDMHIDGFARFANESTIVTMNDDDLLYWQVPKPDIKKLTNASNISGIIYTFVKLPLTKNDVYTTYGKNVGRGSYVNYYIANKNILVPNYNDPNDVVANNIIQKLYPGRKVVGIDCRNLFENGSMVHCVTQQQPKKEIFTSTLSK